MAEWPEFLKGRGLGWAMFWSSMVRQRKVYSPAGIAGREAAQKLLVKRIGHDLGSPVRGSKPRVAAGIFPSGRWPQRVGLGGGRIWASIQASFFSAEGSEVG